MGDEAFRHRMWTLLEPSLRQSSTIESYLNAAADLTAEAIDVAGSYSFCTSLYGRPITVGSSDRAAWDADQVEFDTEDGPCVEALASRSTIDQAIGVLMTQNRCTPDTAFGILRRASQNRNVKLRDVAATIVERFTGHPAADPPPFASPARRAAQEKGTTK
jgi:hypothetical protein